ncbi:flagellar hook protein FlgE [Azonexus sp.]|uniref:flagellar hook protein FlgE n=1 Tax=Azonexus sp. TaxID=1872668 RepID=UPI0027BA97C7|nr:flagellar hook protein FlgE [Azonexus sp.]
MAFQQALSGLTVAGKAIDVTSHNIANASTVGYKQSVSHFADVYAASLNGAGAGQIGIGVNLAAVQQQFTQGNISTTNNPLDISINGAGFFRMDTGGAVSFSRNGQFHLDKNGYIVNDQEMKLTGYTAQSGIIVPSTPKPLQISASNLAPVATGQNDNSAFKGVKINLNLDSRLSETDAAGKVMPPWVNGPATGTWTPNPETYHFSTALTVFDSLGNDHTLTYFFRKDDAASAGGNSTWNVFATMDGTTNAHVTIGGGVPLEFDSNGTLLNGVPPNAMTVSVDLDAVVTDLGGTNNASTPFAFDVDFFGSTQHGTSSGTNRLEQDGFTAGTLVGLSVGNDGVILGRYSNGQTFAQGQIVLANFTNSNGLQPQGDNQWVETSMSGPPMVGAPKTSALGVLTSSSVEESNVDLTSELVNLITNQRNYQANAQSIKTQDQVLQTLVNLR